MLNREYLLEQFRLAEEYLGRARAIAGLSQEEYLRDKNTVDASVRQLTVLFETCHNVGKHLISRYEWRAPGSKAETFEILAEHAVLPSDLGDAFRGPPVSGTSLPIRRPSFGTSSSTRSSKTI